MGNASDVTVNKPQPYAKKKKKKAHKAWAFRLAPITHTFIL